MPLRRLISKPDYIVDQYDDLAWINVYDKHPPEHITYDLQQQGINHAVLIQKTKGNLPSKIEHLFGNPPLTFIVEEFGVKYEIHTSSSHPGLFLDHQRTREWLLDNAKGKSVLNLFSYTGSMTMASAVGGSTNSVSIDLSGPTTQWAMKNAELNNLGPEHQFVKADVFDWTKRFKKKNLNFDIVISDPPSQSRSDELHFSTQKHLDLLHERCIDCVAPGGTLITSINTETLTDKVLLASCHNVADRLGRKIKYSTSLALPEGFESNFRSMRGIRVDFSL